MNINSAIKFTLLLSLTALLTVGCNDRNTETEDPQTSLTESGMKCGAGKCGASMVDGNTIVAKKKKNMLSQMRENDPRKACVLNANTTKALYNCVRNPKSKRLTTKCGNTNNELTMKCGAGKCGSGMSKPKVPLKPVMKCAAGKCGGE